MSDPQDETLTGARTLDLPRGRFVQKFGETELQWLLGWQRTHEIVLAWLGVSRVWVPAGTELPGKKLTWRYLLTTERSALVAFPKQGEPHLLELPAGALSVTDTVGRDLVTIQQQRFQTQLNNDTLFQQLAAVPAMNPEQQLQEVARLNWTYPDREGQNAALTCALLAVIARETDRPLARLEHQVIHHLLQVQGPAAEALEGEQAAAAICPQLQLLLEQPEAAKQLRGFTEDFRLGAEQQRDLVRLTLGLEPADQAAQLALPLHRVVRQRLLETTKEQLERTIVDVTFCRHLLQGGHRQEAQQLLEQRLGDLPDETLSDLLPSAETDLTEGGGQLIRCTILELLALARGDAEVADSEAVAELARLQPLVPARLQELLGVAPEPLRGRATTVQQLMQPGGLEPVQQRDPAGETNAIPAKLVDEILVHPAARKGGALDWLQAWLGKTSVPDYSAIRSYSECVTDRHQEVLAAVTDAAMALGVPQVEAYISRGEKGVGVRAYDGSPPFLLLGGSHLDLESAVHLTPRELRFAVAAEVAHLRFSHTRLTSSEVWDGVYHKGARVLDAFTLLAGPLGFLGKAVQGIEKLSRAGSILSKTSAISQKTADLFGYAKDVKQASSLVTGSSSKREQAISAKHEELLAACRVMQLTADRAALVVTDDLQAGVKALFLTSGAEAQLPMARRHGLARTLHRRDEAGELMHQDLAVRIAALFSFYLGEDYMKLRDSFNPLNKE